MYSTRTLCWWFYVINSTHIVQYEYMNYAHILCICATENTCFLARYDYAHILCICATENTCFLVRYELFTHSVHMCIGATENTCFLARFDYAHILCICATENTCFFSEIWLVPRVWLSCSVSNLHKAELQAKCHGQGSDQQPKIKHLALAKMCLEYSTKLYIK